MMVNLSLCLAANRKNLCKSQQNMMETNRRETKCSFNKDLYEEDC